MNGHTRLSLPAPEPAVATPGPWSFERLLPSHTRYAALVGMVLMLWGLGGRDPLLMAGVGFSFVLIVHLSWRFGEPPAVVFALVYSWLQFAVTPIRAHLIDAEVDGMYGGYPVTEATWLGLAAVVCWALGFRLAQWGHPPIALPSRTEISLPGAILLHLFFVWLAGSIFYLAPPVLKGALPAIEMVSLGTLLMLGLVAYRTPGQWYWFWLVLGVTIVASLGTFFADFQKPLIVALLVLLTAPGGLRLRQVVPATVLVVTALVLGVLWTAVKSPYRDYLSKGTGAQVVLVERDDAVARLVDMVLDLDRERLAGAVDAMWDRIAYVEFFASALSTVPRIVPHQDGEIWRAAVEHVLMPRILFPNKPILDDTRHTERFITHIQHSARDTSISIGFPAEAYVDFGVPWMFLPILALGVFQGLLFRTVLNLWRPYPYFAAAVIVAFGLGIGDAGGNAAKVLAATIYVFLVLAGLRLAMLTAFAIQRRG